MMQSPHFDILEESVGMVTILCSQRERRYGFHPLASSRSVMTRLQSFARKERVDEVAILCHQGGRREGCHPLTPKDGADTVDILRPRWECQWCCSSFGLKAVLTCSPSYDFKGTSRRSLSFGFKGRVDFEESIDMVSPSPHLKGGVDKAATFSPQGGRRESCLFFALKESSDRVAILLS